MQAKGPDHPRMATGYVVGTPNYRKVSCITQRIRWRRHCPLKGALSSIELQW